MIFLGGLRFECTELSLTLAGIGEHLRFPLRVFKNSAHYLFASYLVFLKFCQESKNTTYMSVRLIFFLIGGLRKIEVATKMVKFWAIFGTFYLFF